MSQTDIDESQTAMASQKCFFCPFNNITERRTCENCEAAIVPRVVQGVPIVWNLSILGPDDRDLKPRITGPQIPPQSADELISRTYRGFAILVRDRKERALFLRYPEGMADREIPGCTEDDVKISFGETVWNVEDPLVPTYSFPNIDNDPKREFDNCVARIMGRIGGKLIGTIRIG